MTTGERLSLSGELPVPPVEQALYWMTLLAVIAVNFSVAVSSIAMGCAAALFAWLAVRRPGLLPVRTGLELAFALYIAAELISCCGSRSIQTTWNKSG